MSGRRYRFGPLEQRGLVGPLGFGQIAILALAAVLGLVAIYALAIRLERSGQKPPPPPSIIVILGQALLTVINDIRIFPRSSYKSTSNASTSTCPDVAADSAALRLRAAPRSRVWS